MDYPVNKFPDQLLINIGRGIICFAQTNPGQTVNGDSGERLISEALGIPYTKRQSLDDIRDRHKAWSVKVRYVDDPATVDAVELKLTTRFPKAELTDLSPEHIGAVYLDVWRKLVTKTRENFIDLRTIILLNEKTHRRFALYEYQTHTWNAADFFWKWSTDEETTIHGISAGGHKQFAIHLNDSRLFVRERILQRQLCLLEHIGSPLTIERLAELIGFQNHHVTRFAPVEEISATKVREEQAGKVDIFVEPPKLVTLSTAPKKKSKYESRASLWLFEDCA